MDKAKYCDGKTWTMAYSISKEFPKSSCNGGTAIKYEGESKRKEVYRNFVIKDQLGQNLPMPKIMKEN